MLGVAGLVAGLEYVEERGAEAIHAHEVELCERLWQRLEEIRGFEVFGHRDPARRVGTLSFRSEALPAAELGGILDQAFDIAVRPGCTAPRTSTGRSAPFPTGWSASAPGRSTRRRTSTTSSTR